MDLGRIFYPSIQPAHARIDAGSPIPFPTFTKETIYHVHPLSVTERHFYGVSGAIALLLFVGYVTYLKIQHKKTKRSRPKETTSRRQKRAGRRKDRKRGRRV